MNVLGIGDLASSMLARKNNSDLKSEFVRLTQELATGRKADVSVIGGGNTNSLSTIEHSLKLIDAYAQSQTKVGQKLEHAQISLDAVGGQISGLGASLLASADAGGIASDAVLGDAANKLQGVMSAFSVRAGAAYVFSGDTPNSPPLASPSTILDSLEVATAGATTAADFYQRVDDWFNQPGGFDVVGYTGGQETADGISVSATDQLEFNYTAETEEFKSIFRDLAVITMIDQNLFLGSDEEETALLKSAASGLIGGETGLIKLRAELGEKQEMIAAAATQNAFHQNSLSEMKNEIVGVDLFETAARFEEIQLQLESLYLVTAKSARLTLTEYLR